MNTRLTQKRHSFDSANLLTNANPTHRVRSQFFGPIDWDAFDTQAEANALAGQEVAITGYMIPFDANRDSTTFALSKTPYASCFFCGQAGPETVLAIELTSAVEVTTDKLATVSGIFRPSANFDEDLHTLGTARVVK